MRIGWVRFFVIVVLFAPLACAQVAGTVINKPGPEQGAIVSNIYANEFLGFSFPIPDGWEVNREILGTEREGEAKRTPGGGLELLVVDQHTAKPFRNRIVVSALDATSMSATTQEYVSKFAKVQVNRDGRELVRDAFDVELAGKHFFRADYKQPIPMMPSRTEFKGRLFSKPRSTRTETSRISLLSLAIPCLLRLRLRRLNNGNTSHICLTVSQWRLKRRLPWHFNCPHANLPSKWRWRDNLSAARTAKIVLGASNPIKS